jgi:hypothetical protein
MSEDMVFLSVLDKDGVVVNSGAAKADESLNLYRTAAAQARKLHGDIRQVTVDKETSDKLLVHAHVFLMEGRKTTFDDLMELVLGEPQR